MARTVDPQCRAFQTAIAVLGRPWNALILGVLQAGPLRFTELSRRAKGVGAKILSSRLKELESCGLVIREVDAGRPIRVTYSLTPQGRGFGLVAQAIERWGRDLPAGASAGRRRPTRQGSRPARRPRRAP